MCNTNFTILDLLGEQMFENLASSVKKGLSLSHAKKKFCNKQVSGETLEACFLLLQNQQANTR